MINASAARFCVSEYDRAQVCASAMAPQRCHEVQPDLTLERQRPCASSNQKEMGRPLSGPSHRPPRETDQGHRSENGPVSGTVADGFPGANGVGRTGQRAAFALDGIKGLSGGACVREEPGSAWHRRGEDRYFTKKNRAPRGDDCRVWLNV